MVICNDIVRVNIHDVNHRHTQWITLGMREVPRPLNASRGIAYHKTPENDNVHHFDYTGFLASQEYLTENNLPFVMSTLSEPVVDRLAPSLDYHDTKSDLWGRRMRLWPNILPDRISWKVEGWRVAFWMKLGKPLGMDHRDIVARFAPELFEKGMPLHKWRNNWSRVAANLTMKVLRYRHSVGAPMLDHPQYPETAYERIDGLTEDQVQRDTAWELTDYDGVRCTYLPFNEWNCYFTALNVPPKQPVMKALACARQRILLKKELFVEQRSMQVAAGKKRPIKFWYNVILPDRPADHARKMHQAGRVLSMNANTWNHESNVSAFANTADARRSDNDRCTDASLLPAARNNMAEADHQPSYDPAQYTASQGLSEQQLAELDEMMGYDSAQHDSRWGSKLALDLKPVSTDDMEAWFWRMREKWHNGSITDSDFDTHFYREI